MASGYDAVDDVMRETSGSGKYLNFKKGDKGRVIQIRIVSEPRYVLQHWVADHSGKKSPVDCFGEGCTFCNEPNVPANEDPRRKVAKWGWLVIDRDDEEVKVFTGPTLIARAIKDISELTNKKTGNLVWGDPRTYDLVIERTEEPGAGYYKVDAILEGKGEITPEEKAKVENSGINLEQELGSSANKSENTGDYGGGAAKDLETAPEVQPTETNSNVPDGSEDVSDKDMDDMPF